LMPVATLLSICSEADAFVARAFATTFSVGAVLAFMTIGQAVDLRMGFLLFRTLRVGIALLIVVLAYVLVFAEALLINSLVGRYESPTHATCPGGDALRFCGVHRQDLPHRPDGQVHEPEPGSAHGRRPGSCWQSWA